MPEQTRKLQGFNVRVYGLLIEQGKVLVSIETHKKDIIRKFPGGGVELGEGLEQALKREFREELDRLVEVNEFFHVSKKFHPSYFRPMQLVSLYWRVELVKGEKAFQGHAEPQPLEQEGHYYQLQWMALDQLKTDFFTTPLDQEVAEKLLSGHSGTASLAAK